MLNFLGDVKEYHPLGKNLKLFRGTVVENKDERKLGRIKCYIYDLLPWKDPEKLPWIYPLYPTGRGISPNTSYFSVPKLNSDVIIIFPDNSVYHGYYFATITDRKDRKIDFHSEYPYRYGFSDELENKNITNVDSNVNATETRFSDGSLIINDKKNSTFTFTDKFNNFVHIDRKNKVVHLKMGKTVIEINGDSLVINADHIVINGNKGVGIGSGEGVVVNAPYTGFAGKTGSADSIEEK